MATVIGYQDGITAGVNGLRDLDPSKTLLKKVPNEKGKLEWQPLSVLASTPFDQWKAWDKYERMLRILKDDHDAALVVSPPTDPTEPQPPDPGPEPGYAPQAYNQGSRGQNAKFNIRVNCVQSGNEYVDGHGIRYDDSGLCKGGRSERPVPGLKPSDMMDGKEVWEPYTWEDVTYPPYPPQSYEQ